MDKASWLEERLLFVSSMRRQGQGGKFNLTIRPKRIHIRDSHEKSGKQVLLLVEQLVFSVNAPVLNLKPRKTTKPNPKTQLALVASRRADGGARQTGRTLHGSTSPHAPVNWVFPLPVWIAIINNCYSPLLSYLLP